MKNFHQDRQAALRYVRQYNAEKSADDPKLYWLIGQENYYVGTKEELLALDCDEEPKEPEGFVYHLTWGRVTPESAEQGDTDGNGYVIQGERVQLDMENSDTFAPERITSEVFDTLEELLEEVRSYGPWIEWSSTGARQDDWLISEGHEDFRTGEVITYNLFVYQGGGEDVPLTDQQFAELKSLVKVR